MTIEWSVFMKECCRTWQESNPWPPEHQSDAHLITKTYLCNSDPLKPHFYIVKLGFTGVYIIFHIFAQNIDCGYSLELPRRGGSNEYPQTMFCAEIWKISEFFIRKFSVFGDKIFYLNRHVFVMCDTEAGLHTNWHLPLPCMLVKSFPHEASHNLYHIIILPIKITDHNFNPSLAKHVMPCLSNHCRSRSDGFWRSQLIWICTVCH